MARASAGKPKGMLKNKPNPEDISHTRTLPSPDLRFFIEHFWIIKWDLRDREPVQAEVLPHPSIHLVFERDNTRLAGVSRGKFTRTLQDKGGVFGIKFRPGAFYPFLNAPVSGLRDKTIIPWPIFGMSQREGVELENAILSAASEESAIDIAENFLRQILPEQDENVVVINQIVKRMINDQTITKVDDLVSLFGINKREMQRLFNQYVGVSPKWVIKRYRLHEAVERLNNGDPVDLTRLAVDLGYFDQAHFIKDFKSFVGKSPGEYGKDVPRRSK
ncbi:MAG TPA: helix-turn-helix domain-containing protein [Blastocatellia bacterium]|nr:helix-turn-helix domain-containing protein [Blastocatellia bacterium]